MAVERKNFGEVFEGNKVGVGEPLLTMHRFTKAEEDKYSHIRGSQNVGLFHGADLVAVVDFDDLFDEEGNRFYND
jgi:hypothetical protein